MFACILFVRAIVLPIKLVRLVLGTNEWHYCAPSTATGTPRAPSRNERLLAKMYFVDNCGDKKSQNVSEHFTKKVKTLVSIFLHLVVL